MSYRYDFKGITIRFDDKSPEVLKALENAIDRGLKVCGEKAVGYAQDLCPVDTGNLRGSISYIVDKDDVYIGTNVKYAKYVEFGTGVHVEGGRKTPWTYRDDEGNWHRSTGQKPQPFLKPSAENHAEEYRNILKDSIRNA